MKAKGNFNRFNTPILNGFYLPKLLEDLGFGGNII
jgi:hypothetical protein